MSATHSDLSTALHTAARRYCEKQCRYWSDRYALLARNGRDRVGESYTPEALGMYPRYNVLNAILVDLERLEPSELGDLAETRELLLVAGGTAEDIFTRKPTHEISENAKSEERDSFCLYIQGLDASQLRLIDPLPYRRVLADGEAKAVWDRLRERWSIGSDCWFPLVESKVPNIVGFQDRVFQEAVGAAGVRRILQERGIRRVWELREYGPEYTLDIELLDPIYNLAEGYWSSDQLDWIIYASHESSITVGGWLLDEIKEQWPAWNEHVWDGPFF